MSNRKSKKDNRSTTKVQLPGIGEDEENMSTLMQELAHQPEEDVLLSGPLSPRQTSKTKMRNTTAIKAQSPKNLLATRATTKNGGRATEYFDVKADFQNIKSRPSTVGSLTDQVVIGDTDLRYQGASLEPADNGALLGEAEQSIVEHDLIEYITEMIKFISTGDELTDTSNVEFLAERIQEKISTFHAQCQKAIINTVRDKKQSKSEAIVENRVSKAIEEGPPDRETIAAYLMQIRGEYLAEIESGKSEQEAQLQLGAKIFRGGLITIQTTALTIRGAGATAVSSVSAAGAGISAVGGWTLAGLIYTAQTGVNYRKFRKGEISRREFVRRAELGAVALTGGIAGSAGCAALGFFIGSMLLPFPVLGGVVGTIVGGVAGGVGGRQVTVKVYCKLENKIQRAIRYHKIKKLRRKNRGAKMLNAKDIENIDLTSNADEDELYQEVKENEAKGKKKNDDDDLFNEAALERKVTKVKAVKMTKEAMDELFAEADLEEKKNRNARQIMTPFGRDANRQLISGQKNEDKKKDKKKMKAGRTGLKLDQSRRESEIDTDQKKDLGENQPQSQKEFKEDRDRIRSTTKIRNSINMQIKTVERGTSRDSFMVDDFQHQGSDDDEVDDDEAMFNSLPEADATEEIGSSEDESKTQTVTNTEGGKTYNFHSESDSDLDSENLEAMEYEYALQLFAAKPDTNIKIIERRHKEMCQGILGKKRVACDEEEEKKQIKMQDELIEELQEALKTIIDFRLENEIDEKSIEQPTRYVTVTGFYDGTDKSGTNTVASSKKNFDVIEECDGPQDDNEERKSQGYGGF